MLRNSLGKLKVIKDQDKLTFDDLRQRNKLKKCGTLRWDVYAFVPLGKMTVFNCYHAKILSKSAQNCFISSYFFKSSPKLRGDA